MNLFSKLFGKGDEPFKVFSTFSLIELDLLCRERNSYGLKDEKEMIKFLIENEKKYRKLNMNYDIRCCECKEKVIKFFD